MAEKDSKVDCDPKKCNNQLVLGSLSSALESSLSIVLTENTPTTSPPAPSRKKQSNKFTLHDLLRPLSPGFKSDSDESPTSPRRWSPHTRKKRMKNRGGHATTKSADNSPVRDHGSNGSPSLPGGLETTPVDSLPGQFEKKDSSASIGVPTILVSPDGGEDCLGLERKTSQSSHLSATSSIITSGAKNCSFGSVLSPSGDEEGSVSDQESIRSPLSLSSSYKGSRDGINNFDDDTLSSSPAPTDGETDFIEEDLPSPSHDVNKGMLSLPPPRISSSASKKKKWNVLKRAVQWAPFIQVYKKKYPWVQLAGHQGNFSPGEENGTIIKKSSQDESNALQRLMDDVLRLHVPEFKKEIVKESEVYIEMVDLLRDFDDPAVMDIKMGTRTYVESELAKARVKETLRPDMYEKMIAVDVNEPTPEENKQRAITKPRYMQWRETLSSTATLGFRIEGIKMPGEKPQKEEFKTIRARDDVKKQLIIYTRNNPDVKMKFLQKLYDIRQALERSVFFQNNEVIGSSLLFVYDSNGQVSISMIDFGKTLPLPDGVTVNHRTLWKEGNHEDGYLHGLDNIIEIWKTL